MRDLVYKQENLNDDIEKHYLVFSLQNKFLIWEFKMEKVNAVPVYWLARSIGGLENSFWSANSSLASMAEALRLARYNLNVFIGQVQGLPLSKTAAMNLHDHIVDLIERPANAVLTDSEKNSFYYFINTFQTVITSELPQVNIFYVSQHRDRDMNILINNGESSLSQKTLTELSETSRDVVIREIRSAARCLAFNVATSVGLHLCRAVECAVVKEYLPVLGITPPKNRNLGRYIKLIEDTNKANIKVIGKLREFKDYYRNVITHPDEFWDIDNADSAFGTAINVIDAVMRDVSSIRSKSTADIFATNPVA